MNESNTAVHERMSLVSTNVMRIAGIQGIFGEPCGVDIVPVALDEAVRSSGSEIVLIDAGSVSPLFDVLRIFREHCPKTRLIVIGQEADDTYIECIISAGARGFISGGADAEEFAVALHNVRDGSIWAPRKVLSRLVHDKLNGRRLNASSNDVRFTARESEIIALLTAGQSNRDIAAHLKIDATTVKAHLSRIMRKAGVGNRIELSMYAVKRQGAVQRISQQGSSANF